MTAPYREVPKDEERYKVVSVAWQGAKDHEKVLEKSLNKYAKLGYRLAGFSDAGGAYTLIFEKLP